MQSAEIFYTVPWLPFYCTHTVQRRKLQAATNLQVNLANGQSAFYTTTPQRSAAELEEDSSGDESDCGAWNWREDDR